MSISNLTHSREVTNSPVLNVPLCARRQTSARRRSGITLTEVLISVFVLGSGLLGLAALVPLGQYHAIQATHQDRSAACARWVFRQFEGQTRTPLDQNFGLLNSFSWVNRAGTPVYLPGLSTPRAVIIDPRLIAVNATNPDLGIDSFPYNANMALGVNWDLQRVTFADPVLGGIPMRTFLANELCIWTDDILFDAANDNDRPILQQSNSTPTTPSGANVSADGTYSWLAMVRPAEHETLPRATPELDVRVDAQQSGLLGGQPTQFVVTVIVTHNRSAVISLNEDVPSERLVQAQAFGPGWFELDNSGALGARIGKLLPNQWVMISAPQLDPAGESPSPPLWFHRWYKIVNVADRPGGGRAIKVAGPDWPGDMVDGGNIVCTIIDGAVGVYERQMTHNITFDNPVGN